MSAIVQDPVRTYALAGKRACSSLVAVWVLSKMGLVPRDPTNQDAWIALKKPLWLRINLAGPGNLIGSFDNLKAIKGALGGSIVIYPSAGKDGPAPVLSPGKWHVVQRWCGNAGHAYLVYYAGGDIVRVVDSNKSVGFRDRSRTLNDWYAYGCSEGVLTVGTDGFPLWGWALLGLGGAGLLYMAYRYRDVV